jgi:MIP family channel proteins
VSEAIVAAPERPVSRVTLPQRLAAEAIGTFMLVFAGCGAIVISATRDGAIAHEGIAATFGLTIMVGIYAVGHVSGAHFNPGVTLAFAATRHFPLADVAPYWLAQAAGGLIAASLLRALFGNIATSGATLPATGESDAFILEVVLTFFLMFVIAAVATDERAVGQAAAIAIGATVGLEALFAGPISGASMNPVRSLAPAVVSGELESLWLYLVAPPLGAILGAFAYTFVRGASP